MVLKRNTPASQVAKPSVNQVRAAVERRDGNVTPFRDIRHASLATAVIETDDIGIILGEVGALWAQAQMTFMAIGRYLYQARQAISRRVMEHSPGIGQRERELLVASEFRAAVLNHLPFGNSVAHQLESVARAVFIQQRLSADEVPNSYSVAYQLTTLSDDELNHARNNGLLRPDIRRESIIGLKRQIRSAPENSNYSELGQRRERLLAVIEKAQRELSDIDAQMDHIQERSEANGVEVS